MLKPTPLKRPTENLTAISHSGVCRTEPQEKSYCPFGTGSPFTPGYQIEADLPASTGKTPRHYCPFCYTKRKLLANIFNPLTGNTDRSYISGRVCRCIFPSCGGNHNGLLFPAHAYILPEQIHATKSLKGCLFHKEESWQQ